MINTENIKLDENFLNVKNQKVNSIMFLPETMGTNLTLLRLNDYKLLRENKMKQNI